MAIRDSASANSGRVEVIHAHRPYRSAALVTGESVQLLPLSRRDDGNTETLEEMLRRLRELCRLMAYVSALEAAAAGGDRDILQRSADAHTLLEPYLWLYRPDGTPRVNPTQAEVAEGIDRSDGMLYESPALGETKRLRKIQRWNHQLAGRTGRIQDLRFCQ